MTNRELDAWISENIFGKPKRCPHERVTYPRPQSSNLNICNACGEENGDTTLAISQSQVNYYTTSPAEAMEVLKKCLKTTAIRIGEGKPNAVMVGDLSDIIGDCEAPTLERAIVEFAFKLFSK